MKSGLKIAIVHDFLYTYAGAERVLEQILKEFPTGELFSLFDFLPDDQRGFLGGRSVTSSFIQRMPMARTRHRHYLPLMPMAIEGLDVSKFDIIISSSYVAAKGILTRADQLHICYCHTPVRFAWDLQKQCLDAAGLGSGIRSTLIRAVLHYIRAWDVQSSNRVDVFVSNSDYVGRRIEKCYRRPSVTIYPPVDLKRFSLQSEKKDFYLTASRLVPYKRIDLIVDAFTAMPDKQLVVVGEGPELTKLKAKAGKNVMLVGHQSAERLVEYMRDARAFVFAAEEDFGIVAVEAQATGTPVIAFGRGGIRETVIPGETGVFFDHQTVESLTAAVEQFEVDRSTFDPVAIRSHAEQFSVSRFREEFSSRVRKEWEAFSNTPPQNRSYDLPEVEIGLGLGKNKFTDREPKVAVEIYPRAFGASETSVLAS